MKELTVENLINRKHVKPVKNLITERHMKELTEVVKHYNVKTIKNRVNNIVSFIQYDVEGDWVERLKIIVNELKKDVISDYALEIRYGKNNVEKIKETFKDRYGITEERFVKQFGEVEGVQKWEDFKVKSKTPWGLTLCIQKFGGIEGPKKWEERLDKKVKTMAERKKIKPYRNGQTLPEYQERYGIEDGYKRWEEKGRKMSYWWSKDRFIDQYGEIEGLKNWGEYCLSNDKSSLESYIRRYGEETGVEKYDKFVERLRYTNSEEYYVQKYGEELGKIKYKELLIKKNHQSLTKYSKISQELFWSVFEQLDDVDTEVYFGELNGEYIFFPWTDGLTIINVDFKYGNKVIEFDGDYWHSKPEQKVIDNKRDNFLKTKGYEVLRVRECDYRGNKELIVSECVKFLNKK